MFGRLCVFSQVSVMLLWAVSGNDCPDSFDCGTLGTIRFPFTTAEHKECGALAIQGCDGKQQFPFINIKDRKFRVTKIAPWFNFNAIEIIDDELTHFLRNGSCEAFDRNITLPPPSHLGSFTFLYTQMITLFKCQRNLNVSAPKTFFNYTSCDRHIFFAPTTDPQDSDDVPLPSLPACSTIQLPTAFGPPISANPFAFLTAQLSIQFNPSPDCAQCTPGQDHHHRQQRKGRSWTWKLVLVLSLVSSVVVVVVVALLLLLAWCFGRKQRCFWNGDLPTDDLIIERFLKQHGSLPTRRYSYFEIKKLTSCFKVKLGQGGYGSVYKGNLQDGRLVAVKVLSELKGTGEEFINEVASISRTSHVNIVTLVGFCFQGSKRALVYEFMPNGSLEKFIYEENANIVGRQLDCKTLYDIAIGVAHGLDYLHRGCNTKIFHFDIKPHNILLDEDFCPKISDFGLAKICPRKESIVSMMCARGTIGYIAPELFSRNFGVVSHKADVYSYGMLVLEMVGGRHNKNVLADRSSELYFPHWIYKRLELNQDFGLVCVKNGSDRETVRKMIVVSLWCIQTDPSSRPSMNKVVEMLEGSLESLTLPPTHFPPSSPTSPTHYSSQTSETLYK